MESTSISEYRKFLYSLCEELTAGNLIALKYLCRDRLTTRELEEINTATNLFLCLEQRQDIASDNLHLLEDLLTRIRREDLVRKLKEFERKQRGANHNPRNGFVDFDDGMQDIVSDAAEQTTTLAGNNNDPDRPLSAGFVPRGTEQIMLRDISADVYEELGFLLNPATFKNWVLLAGKLGYTNSHVMNFKLCPTYSTQMLLQDWAQRGEATVFKLYQTLKDIGREDAAEKLESSLVPSRGTV